MIKFKALRENPDVSPFQKGDYFVLFGELFGRGYANGLVNMAKATGMHVISMSMGRRELGVLRPLRREELTQAEELLGGKVINIPLEAGFDLDAPDGKEDTPVSRISGLKLDSWQDYEFDADYLADCRQEGQRRLVSNLKQAIKELEGMIDPGKNIFFAHTMAGGFPRAKILIALANRIFKGRGSRYISSGSFWNHSLGQFVAKNFLEVTANTMSLLIQNTNSIRQNTEKLGGKVYYSAYGYHGAEILIDGAYRWQTYTPYQQGHAKMELEKVITYHRSQGVRVTVYNCPEIRTNSSDIFSGVELSLFPLLHALEKESRGGNAWVAEQRRICELKLKSEHSLNSILRQINSYLTDSSLKNFFNFEKWPMENTLALSDLMVGTSGEIVKKHKDSKNLISDYLSSLVLRASGKIIFNHLPVSQDPVLWIGHDIIARNTLRNKAL